MRKTLKPPETEAGSENQNFRIDRRNFVKTVGLAAPIFSSSSTAPAQDRPSQETGGSPATTESRWPVLRRYDQRHLARIALPLGGIGTGTVSLGGRGDLRDWEIMNRPAKGFIPLMGQIGPFFALFVEDESGRRHARALQGPVEVSQYEGSHGSPAVNENFPCFPACSFETTYPFARVVLSDPDLPLDVALEAFNPLVPADVDASSIPVAVLSYRLKNRSTGPVLASVCGSLCNFIGMDGWDTSRDWKGDEVTVGARGNRNEFRRGESVRGIFMHSEGVFTDAAQWGTMALVTLQSENVSYRTAWLPDEWGVAVLDFWDDFSADGQLEERKGGQTQPPMASLAATTAIPAGEVEEVRFLITWHFPNRYTWTPSDPPNRDDRVFNYYTTRYSDAWDVAEKTAAGLEGLENRTRDFVQTVFDSSLPPEVKEAALFNLSTLRTQTCFRTPDGRFYGWEGTGDRKGCCHGSCTHVWNYEQATAFLFGELALQMRQVEFTYSTNDDGLMSFRVNLPLGRGQHFGKAAADGQMGCIMKIYRDWQLSGNDRELRWLWPKVRKAVEFCWIPGGWDADQDGVMEGCQHNTMDVEYYGPNPQMGIWYLGALRAAAEMASYVGEGDFAVKCRKLFEDGRRWIDANLFNGEYYEHQVQAPSGEVPPGLRVGMGAKDASRPEYQLGPGCLVDQLVGQYMAHICEIGYLVERENVRRALASILEYNRRESFGDHFNCLRSFVLGDESGLLMASYPKGRPPNPFPYFTEVMTGFEYAAAIGMLYEGMTQEGLRCIRDVRARYDGLKRNPFDEAECGHHYARAMASWAAILALSGFFYSGVTRTIKFAGRPGRFFWSNGWAWGDCELRSAEAGLAVRLLVKHGVLAIDRVELRGIGVHELPETRTLSAGEELRFSL